ncbi:NADPH-dependent FMN reductase [Nocardiopsis alba]|uniref:NADPH-dependent FMN reductase n=1 Tax=Nocardiopsis alba TaxID=53437 RepID=UPI003668DE23
MPATTTPPRIVLLSGSLNKESVTDRIALWCAERVTATGAEAEVYTGDRLDFPLYSPSRDISPVAHEYLRSMENADGVVLLSPAYHGTVSGVLKNAADYVNELLEKPRPLLDGRAMGCVSVSLGEQGAGTTLSTLRTMAHALRAWPTPLGVALPRSRAALDDDNTPLDPGAVTQLEAMLRQTHMMASLSARRRAKAAAQA